MAVLTQHFGYRQLDRSGNRDRRIQGGSYIRMLDATGKGSREGLRIGDPSGDITASVRLIAVFEPVDPGSALVWIELGGILQVLYPVLVHFLGDPAFVADMRVAA